MTSQQRILMFCGNGYLFSEVFEPIIKDMREEYVIDILLGDYYLTDYTLNSVRQLFSTKKIASYRFIHLNKKHESAFVHHKKMWSIVQSVRQKKFDLLLTGGDFSYFDRYLINLARSVGAIVVVLQTGSIWRILEEYRKMTNRDRGSQSRPSYRKSMFHKMWLDMLKPFLRKIKWGIKGWGRKLSSFRDYCLFPLIFTKHIFLKNRYDKFAFTSGRANAVICYDTLEIEALERVIPKVKNLYLAKHPLEGLCRCAENLSSASKAKLLVAFAGNLSTELEGYKFKRWINAIKRAIELAGIKEIHLRFHPRTSKNLAWPHKLTEEISKSGCEVKIIDALKVSLSDIICDYVGIIGASSGSLRVARAVCKKIFVVGLPNCSDGGPDDKEWILGNAEGINWIRENEELEMKHFSISSIKIPDRPSVPDILNKILVK